MADSESGYKVGPGRPPLHTRFKKGQFGAGAVREAAKAAIEKLGAPASAQCFSLMRSPTSASG